MANPSIQIAEWWQLLSNAVHSWSFHYLFKYFKACRRGLYCSNNKLIQIGNCLIALNSETFGSPRKFDVKTTRSFKYSASWDPTKTRWSFVFEFHSNEHCEPGSNSGLCRAPIGYFFFCINDSSLKFLYRWQSILSSILVSKVSMIGGVEHLSIRW